ncbi:MAG TPA: pyrroloquinoline quinone biosynthesis protein PqqB [Candidatus Sulfotelmatobacter sp.]|nr:pyrroloquinoline quinone biosynthesis protein PqqB [Candidatus Sulfotelmatobacter sp.]
MQIKVLGSAAGGGFPQWNCACPNCRSLRAGTFHGKPRTQAQVALGVDSEHWFLLGASPDLRTQIESTPELHPHAKDNSTRHSPICGAVLLNADIDHILGLLLMRELQPLQICATNAVRQIIEDNSMFAMLQRVQGQLSWTSISLNEWFALHSPSRNQVAVRCRTVSLGTHFPAYIPEKRISHLDTKEASLGLIVEAPSGKRLAFMPAVPRITDELSSELDHVDVLLFDGTFWGDDELIRIQGSGQTAQQMGHVPVSSPTGSLAQLAHLKRPRKIYVHINNTNPMLKEDSPEYRQVREAGWEVAEDGWQFEL